MNKIPETVLHVWSILFKSDLYPVRLFLSLSSLIWVGWAIFVITVTDPVMKFVMTDREVMFSVAPIWVWMMLFAIHGFWSLALVISKAVSRSALILVSAMGALLWSFNASLLVISNIDTNLLALMSAHWSLAMIAWWIFIRNCYGR